MASNNKSDDWGCLFLILISFAIGAIQVINTSEFLKHLAIVIIITVIAYRILLFILKKHKEKIKPYLVVLSGIIGIILYFSYDGIIDKFTPVEKLTLKYYEQSTHYTKIYQGLGRVGANCCDGTKSTATGRGACSYHGGVCSWIMDTIYNYEPVYGKTLDECRKEAEATTWIK